MFASTTISEDAEDSQFLGQKETYPTQPVNFWTNVLFFLPASAYIAISIKQAHFHTVLIYNAWVDFLMGVVSGLFHGSTGYGYTGVFDVAFVVITITQHIFSRFLILYYANSELDAYHPHDIFTTRYTPRSPFPTSMIYQLVFTFLHVIFLGIYMENGHYVSWTAKWYVFAVLLILATVAGLYGVYKLYAITSRITEKHSAILTMASIWTLSVFIVVVVLETDSEWKHGLTSHVLPALVIYLNAYIDALLIRMVWNYDV